MEKRVSILLCFLLLFTAFILPTHAAGGAHYLAENGRTGYRIVTGESAPLESFPVIKD